MSDAQESGKLVTSLRELQQDVAPKRDLWSSIEGAIKEDVALRSRSRQPRRSWLLPMGVAAATSFLAIGLWLGRASVDSPPMVAQQQSTQQPIQQLEGSVVTAVLAVDAEYAALRTRLEGRAIAGLANLSDEERQEVAGSLTTIQQAVRELETALGKDPSNALLQVLLVQSCQEEMRVLTTLERMADPVEETLL